MTENKQDGGRERLTGECRQSDEWSTFPLGIHFSVIAKGEKIINVSTHHRPHNVAIGAF